MNFTPYITPPTYNNGIMQQSMIPNIGGIGYNNNYYNSYNSYYNPMHMMKQREEYEKAVRQEQDNQLSIYKKLVKCSNRFNGRDINDEEIDKSFYTQRGYVTQDDSELVKDMSEYNRLQPRTVFNENYVSRRYINMKNNDSNVARQYQTRDPLDKSFYDYMETAGGLYIQGKIEEADKNAKNLTQLYDQNDYSQLLNMHRTSRFDAFTKNFNIDDMEIQLPSQLRSEYSLRKQEFVNQLLSN